MKLVSSLTLLSLASLGSGTRVKRQDLDKIQVFRVFEDYLEEKLEADQKSGDLTEKQLRIQKLRVELIKEFRNVTDLPSDLVDWYERSLLPDGRTGCSGLECNVFIPFEAIWEYGCWCYFGEAAGTGIGKPVNPMDQACKELQLCYRCTKIDSMGDADICYPGQQDYMVEMSKVVGGIMAACSEPNAGDDCAIHTCCCETDFVRKILMLFFSGYTFDPSYHHDNWDHTGKCHIDGDPFVPECCGEYPTRKPYNSEVMECCKENKLFNPDSHKCCMDGSVVSDNVNC